MRLLITFLIGLSIANLITCMSKSDHKNEIYENESNENQEDSQSEELYEKRRNIRFNINNEKKNFKSKISNQNDAKSSVDKNQIIKEKLNDQLKEKSNDSIKNKNDNQKNLKEYQNINGDILDTWNNIAINTIIINIPNNPPEAARILAILNTVMFDSINKVLKKKEFNSSIPLNNLVTYTVCESAYTVLITFYANQRNSLDSSLLSCLQSIGMSDTNNKTEQLHYFVVKNAVGYLKTRLLDGANEYVLYSFRDGSKYFKVTENGYANPIGPQYAYVNSFLLNELESFIPSGPYSITSRKFQEDCEEAYIAGSFYSSNNDQMTNANFWKNTLITPPGVWISLVAGPQYKLIFSKDVLSRANALRLTAAAIADAALLTWKTKYAYNFLRPYTAIISGICEFANDTNYRPYVTIPTDRPSFPNSISLISATAAKMISYFKGKSKFSFCFASVDTPAVSKCYNNLWDVVEEASLSSVFRGQSFRHLNMISVNLGKQLGDEIIQRLNKDTKDSYEKF